MNSKYDFNDLKAIAKGEKSKQEIADKYGVSIKTLNMALYRNDFRVYKQIKITSPYATKYVADIQKCADELNVSRSTIKNALKGKSVPCLDELGIKVEIAEDDL